MDHPIPATHTATQPVSVSSFFSEAKKRRKLQPRKVSFDANAIPSAASSSGESTPTTVDATFEEHVADAISLGAPMLSATKQAPPNRIELPQPNNIMNFLSKQTTSMFGSKPTRRRPARAASYPVQGYKRRNSKDSISSLSPLQQGTPKKYTPETRLGHDVANVMVESAKISGRAWVDLLFDCLPNKAARTPGKSPKMRARHPALQISDGADPISPLLTALTPLMLPMTESLKARMYSIRNPAASNRFEQSLAFVQWTIDLWTLTLYHSICFGDFVLVAATAAVFAYLEWFHIISWFARTLLGRTPVGRALYSYMHYVRAQWEVDVIMLPKPQQVRMHHMLKAAIAWMIILARTNERWVVEGTRRGWWTRVEISDYKPDARRPRSRSRSRSRTRGRRSVPATPLGYPSIPSTPYTPYTPYTPFTPFGDVSIREESELGEAIDAVEVGYSSDSSSESETEQESMMVEATHSGIIRGELTPAPDGKYRTSYFDSPEIKARRRPSFRARPSYKTNPFLDKRDGDPELETLLYNIKRYVKFSSCAYGLRQHILQPTMIPTPLLNNPRQNLPRITFAAQAQVPFDHILHAVVPQVKEVPSPLMEAAQRAMRNGGSISKLTQDLNDANKNLPPMTPNTFNQELIASYTPVFYIIRDATTKTIILALRGTSSLHDAIIDLTAKSEPFEVPHNCPRKEDPSADCHICTQGPYKVHSGILRAVHALMLPGSQLLKAIREALQQNDGYGLVIVGHSLGAALGSLLACYIADMDTCLTTGRSTTEEEIDDYDMPKGRKVHVYAFATPCSFDIKLASMLENLVTTVISGWDIIPRMSLGHVREWRGVVVEAASKHFFGKVTGRFLAGKTFRSVFGLERRAPKAAEAPAQNDAERDADWYWRKRSRIEKKLDAYYRRYLEQGDGDHEIKMYPAGKVYWVRAVAGATNERRGREPSAWEHFVQEKETKPKPQTPRTPTDEYNDSDEEDETMIPEKKRMNYDMYEVKDVEKCFGRLVLDWGNLIDHMPEAYVGVIEAMCK